MAREQAFERCGDLIIGVDEAGRGCLGGPVVAGAVILGPASPDEVLPGLDDSKKLDARKRQELAPLIRQQALACGVGVAWQDEIDAVNILNATFRAMCRAVACLLAELDGPPEHGPGPEAGPEAPAATFPTDRLCLYIDGSQTIPDPQWELSFTLGRIDRVSACPLPLPASMARTGGMQEALARCCSEHAIRAPRPPERPLPLQRAMVRGDGRCASIAAASILAKTARDGIMEILDPFFPGYGFARHKGYASKEHQEALIQKGPCPIHRMTFRKVRPEESQLSLFQTGS